MFLCMLLCTMLMYYYGPSLGARLLWNLHGEAGSLYGLAQFGVHHPCCVQPPRTHHLRPGHPLPTGEHATSLDPERPLPEKTSGHLLFTFNNRRAAVIFLEFPRETCDFRLGGSFFHQSNQRYYKQDWTLRLLSIEC